MRTLINQKYLCICLIFVLALVLLCSPLQVVLATEMTEEAQEIIDNVETLTEPAEEGVVATEPIVSEVEDTVIVDENEPTEGSDEATEPSETVPKETDPGTVDGEETKLAELETIKESLDYRVFITTKILASDVFYINGSPTFIYKIEQLTEDGSITKYWYKSITIEKEYTELMTDQNGCVCVETELVLPSGTYRVTSEQTGRYNADQKVQEIVLDFRVIELSQNDTTTEGVNRKDLFFYYTKSGSRNLPSSSCAATPGCVSVEYVGISLKANKGVYDANTPILKDDFTLLLVKSDGSTEAVSMDGVSFDFSTKTDIFPNKRKYPNVSGEVNVSVFFAFDGIAYYTDTVINLYQEPYILYLETALKAGKEDNGLADHYLVTAVYSDGARQLLLPAVTANENVVTISSNNVKGKWTRNFQFASYLSIRFINNSSTSGVGEPLTINGNVLYGQLTDMRVAGDKIEIIWSGKSDWTMVITPVSTSNGESCVPTYTMVYSGGRWTAVVI